MSENNPIESPVEPVVDQRDVEAQAAIEEMEQQEQAVVDEETNTNETKEQKAASDCEALDADTARQMLSYGLWAVEVSVGGVFDVPFQIEEPVGNKWLDASVPMLQKYGPAGLEWFAKYQGELMFAMASCSLVGGSAIQVRRLRQEKIINQAKAAKEQHESENQSDNQGEPDETAQPSQQE